MPMTEPARAHSAHLSRLYRAALTAFNVLMVALIIACAPPIAFRQRPTPGVPRATEGLRPDQMASVKALGLTIDPIDPIISEMVTVKFQLQNTGNTALLKVPVYLYVGDHSQGVRDVDLAPKSVTELTFSWVPAGAGLYVLTATVDPNLQLAELDRLNNFADTEVVVAPQPSGEVELSVTDLNLIDQPTAPTVLRAVVKNTGSQVTQTPLIFRADGQVFAKRLIGPLKPNETISVDAYWPKQSTPKNFSAEVNPRFSQTERSPKDNLRTYDPVPQYDLRVEALSVYSMKREQEYPSLVTISFVVRNTGQLGITRSFRTRIDPGQTITDPNGSHLSPYYVTTNELAAGQAVYISRTLKDPPASFDISVYADFDQSIAEQNEYDNIAETHYGDPTAGENRWYSIGPRSLTGGLGASGRLAALAIDPGSPNVIYVGAPSGDPVGGTGGSGVWKTTDGGLTWFPVSDSLPGLRVSALAIDPSEIARVYLTSPGLGVFVTQDAGTSWTELYGDSRFNGDLFLVSPADPNLLFVSSDKGVFRSADRGMHWQLVLSGGSVKDLTFDRTQPNRLLATLWSEDSSVVGLYETANAGISWRKLTGCPAGSLPTVVGKTSITVAQTAGKWYAAYLFPTDTEHRFTVYHTTDTACLIGGRSENVWEAGWSIGGEPGSPEAGWADSIWYRVSADPLNANYVYASGTQFYVSSDGGRTFHESPGPHVDHHAFAVNPTAPQIIYTASDGGLYRSDNRGAANSWRFISNGVANVEFYDLAHASIDSQLIIGGTQDNGTNRYMGTIVWTQFIDGDGATVDVDPTNPNVQYAMHQYGPSIMRWTPETGPQGIGLPVEEDQCQNLHFQIHPSNSDLMLASCLGSLWQSSTTPPGNWSIIFSPKPPDPPDPPDGIAFSQIDPSVNLYYAGSVLGNIYAGSGGSNWRTVFGHPNRWEVTDIEVDPSDPTRIYASFRGDQGRYRIYQLKRTGPAPNSLIEKDITFDLPSGAPIRAIAVDRANPLTVYAALIERGVYRGRSYDGGNTWTWSSYNDGLPYAVDVRDLLVHPISGVLRAATFGRSAFEVNTSAPVGSILAARGRITYLRVADVGEGWGPPNDRIDGEVVMMLDTEPGKAYGFQLRTDVSEAKSKGMLDLLRDAFENDTTISIDYSRTGVHTGTIIRVVEIP